MEIKSYKNKKLITNFVIKTKKGSIGGIDIQDPRVEQINLLEVDFKDPDKYMAFELQEISKFTTDSFETIFLTPNNISLLLHVYRNELKKYKLTLENHVLKNDLGEKYKKKNKLTYTSKMIYEMIQFAETAIIFGYTAVEAFANSCIPENYTYEFKNNKGILEKYDLKATERWLSLSDKLKNVLTEIFGKHDLADQQFWSDFKELESLRNSIIHLKKEDHDFFYVFFKKSTIRVIESAEKIIDYFVDIETNVGLPLSGFKDDLFIFKSIILAEEVKNLNVGFLSEIDSNKSCELKELLKNFKENKHER